MVGSVGASCGERVCWIVAGVGVARGGEVGNGVSGACGRDDGAVFEESGWDLAGDSSWEG